LSRHKAKKRATHRTPPPHPIIELVKSEKYPVGYCHLCGKMLPKKDGTPNLARHWCDGDCREQYLRALEMQDPAWLRCRVRERDKGRCAHCGKIVIDWDMDHIVPLALAPRDISYWSLSNLQTLCKNCHKKKTLKDMADIRAAKALQRSIIW
jgi:5-methylcytosine-specific restriction endonuclease McrA